MATEYPMVNGHRYDFSSVEARIKGKLYKGFKSVNYSQNLEPGEARGNHAQRLGTTRGELKAEADAEMYREEFDELIRDLGDGFMEARFPIVVSYADDGQKVSTDTLHTVRITGVENSNGQGTDALAVKLTLSPDWVDYNGKKPLKRMLK